MSEAARPRPGKKRHRAAEAEPEPEFQIAPMIDILLVLLVFFMSISTTEVLQSNQQVSLPVAKEAKAAKPAAGQVIINVTYSAINNAVGLEVNEKIYPAPSALVSVLQRNVAQNPVVRVLIRADRQVRYEYMRSLLEAVGQAGVANVTFSVVDKEEPKPSS